MKKEIGLKYDTGKPQAGLLANMPRALLEVAKVLTSGAKKYSRDNWQFVDNGIERYTDAMWRHLLQEGIKEADDETGIHHAAHALCCMLFRLELMLREKEGVGVVYDGDKFLQPYSPSDRKQAKEKQQPNGGEVKIVVREGGWV